MSLFERGIVKGPMLCMCKLSAVKVLIAKEEWRGVERSGEEFWL